ncbi:MAG: hypothetical protein ACLR23_07790 [Clostridia bacterium]
MDINQVDIEKIVQQVLSQMGDQKPDGRKQTAPRAFRYRREQRLP